MPSSSNLRVGLYSSCLLAALVTVSCTSSAMRPTAMSSASGPRVGFEEVIGQHARTMLDEGRHTFRFDTFGREASGLAPSSFTERSQGPSSAASAPGSARKRRSQSG